MADTEEKAPKAPKGPKAEQGDRSPRRPRQQAKGGDKASQGRMPPAKPKGKRPEQRVTPRLRTHFDEVVRKQLTEQNGYKNPMQVPTIQKVVINMGIGEGVNDRKKVDQAAADLAQIAGQKAIITKSRKSIATYKLRDGQAIGCKVTLRKSPHVRVHRPPGHHRAAARARLPRSQSQELRRPRQLHARHQGAPHFPGDRLRQGVGYLGHGHHGLHEREDRRRGARAC